MTCYEVLILSERLHSVTAQFDQLKAVRFQDATNRAIPCRKLNRVTRKDSVETSKSDELELKEPDELHSEPLRVQQLLDDETRALQMELSSLLDTVQETETKMVEMSTLNHPMSTHVLQQAQQIEHLYEQLTTYLGEVTTSYVSMLPNLPTLLSKARVGIDPNKVKSVVEWAILPNVKGVRGLLRLNIDY
ncbi:syntaxin-81-like [Abrus precatorius]|uniref:Syntaxin-81-like n=1 Tax=Abrus precatorius TaxID=3816 RepID=A0A8B8M6X9_ABRPR|nr:syntaxin-81-like [Abrus precatorius]